MISDRAVQWEGVPIDEMSREELIEAFNGLARLNRSLLRRQVSAFRGTLRQSNTYPVSMK